MPSNTQTETLQPELARVRMQWVTSQSKSQYLSLLGKESWFIHDSELLETREKLYLFIYILLDFDATINHDMVSPTPTPAPILEVDLELLASILKSRSWQNIKLKGDLDLREDLKFKGGDEQLSWLQKFYFSICLIIFV